MKMKKRTMMSTAIAAALALATAFTGCAGGAGSSTAAGSGSSPASSAEVSSAPASSASTKKYVIAMDVNYAPFEFKKDDKWVGIDVELLKAVAQVENFSYEEKHMNFSGIIPALQANQVDASLAAMFINDKRKQVLDFSDGYFESGVGAFVKSDSKISGVDDFKGKKVAVKKGETGAAWAEENKSKYNLTIQYFDDAPSLFQQVTDGGADIGMTDYPVVAYRMTIDKNSGVKMVGKFDKADYGFAVPKGQNQDLLQKFNDGIKKLKANGEYDKIVKKYINVQ